MKPPLEFTENPLFPWNLEKATWAVNTWNQMVEGGKNPAEREMSEYHHWMRFAETIQRGGIAICAGKAIGEELRPHWGSYSEIDNCKRQISFRMMRLIVETMTLHRAYAEIFTKTADICSWIIWLQQIRYSCPNEFTVILDNHQQVAKFAFAEDNKVTLTMMTFVEWMKQKGFGTESNLAPQWQTGLIRMAEVQSETLNEDKFKALTDLPIAKLRNLVRSKNHKPSMRLSKSALATWYLTGHKPE